MPRLFAFYLVFLTPLWAVFLPGCAPTGRSRPSTPAIQNSAQALKADWDDVDAAVEVGCSQSECVAAKPALTPDGLSKGFRIKHVSGRLGAVVVRTTETGPDPRHLEVSCEMSPLRDPALESAIVRNIAHRLEQLKDKGYAPIEP